MLEIRETNNKNRFLEMRDSWNRTLKGSIDDNIFLTWEKMAPSVEQLGEGISLKILFAAEGEKLIGIAPFRKTVKRLRGTFRYTLIEPVTNGNTDYTGIILTEQEAQCLSLFLTYLLSQKDWDLFHLPDLPQNSLTLELMNAHRDLPFFRIEKGEICPYITIPESKEKLMSNLDCKFRKELQRRLRKLEKEQGKVELMHHYELGSLKKTMEILFELHQKRWVLKGESGVFAEQNKREVTIKTAKYFAEKDWLRLHFLTVNDRPVAAQLDLEYEGKMLGHLCGFDPDYSKYSVGNLLFLMVLQGCVDKGISEYDFMQGDESYKFDWTKKYRQNVNVKFVNKKLASRLVYVVLNALNMSKFCVRKLFPNTSLVTAYSLILQRIFRLQ